MLSIFKLQTNKLLSTSFPHRYISRGKLLIMETLLKPPDHVRYMKILNKELIKTTVEVPYLSVKKDYLNNMLPVLKKYFLKLERYKPIQHVDNLVEVYLTPECIRSWSDLPDDVKSTLEQMSITKDNLKVKNFELTYDNFSAEDLLKAILPNDKEGLSSFTKVGHIVHINLREHLLPFKNIIGEILYDKIPGCKSVVNKVNIIDNTYRNFSMEILKGDDDMLTTVKENNCNFKFDFSKVYWNSRLSTEHERIVKKLNRNDVLFDVFAGVGPFSIPAAKKKCSVYANDLNPESFKWLEHNAKTNKVSNEYFKSFNKDGADFIKNEIKQFLPDHLKNGQKVYITMNLPAMAVEFLNNFEGLFSSNELLDFNNVPLLFVYCFVKGEDYIKLAKDLVKDNFKCTNDDIIDIFKVRTVSSLKEMMRITIKLEKELLVGNNGKRKLEESLEVDSKRSCISAYQF